MHLHYLDSEFETLLATFKAVATMPALKRRYFLNRLAPMFCLPRAECRRLLERVSGGSSDA